MIRVCLLRLTLFTGLSLAPAQAQIVVDASKVAAPPAPLNFETGGKSPSGRTIAINSRYLSLDGKPWFPVMGEFHYSRVAPENWERELLKMKAGGITIVSSYVFWIHHEEIEGQFDWSGRRDLRRFVELAGRCGLYVWVRVGPWDHGEVRNGGLPDWVLAKSKTRQNDPAYLQYVARFYGEIGRQLKGLFWKDGGPIAGVQIENEYHDRGPGKGEEHILKLKQMAQAAGLDAPFYSITGWDDAAVPQRGVIPVFGGYPDGFWYRTDQPLPPSPDYFFTRIRTDETVDEHLRPKRADTDARYANYPYLTAEMAGGMASAYHRRPLMSADDIAALEVAKLGSGVTLYGYYMFHGGTNPDGKLTTLQESQATGYWNDLPLKGYDFQAPLGEFGQMHPSFRVLKSFHLFLHDFGGELAPMVAYFADKQPAGKFDRETPRVAVRSDSKSGYIFVNNYQKDAPMPARNAFQVTVKLASGAIAVPRTPIVMPAGAYLFWPVESKLGDAALEYATAEPLCHLEEPDTTVFFAWPGIDPEFSFHDAPGVTIEAPSARVVREHGRIYVNGITPGLGTAMRIRRGDRVTQVLVLSREEAGNLWKAPLAGRARLVYSSADVYFQGDGIHLASSDPDGLAFSVYPASEKAPADFTQTGANGIFNCYRTRVPRLDIKAEVKQTAEPGKAAPARIGQQVALVPDESAFQAAARWSIRIPKIESPSVDETLLRISYVGDIARIYAGGALVTDEFFKGQPWEIGRRGRDAGTLELVILPLRDGAPIYISKEARPAIPAGGQVAKVTEVRVLPVYKAVAELRP